MERMSDKEIVRSYNEAKNKAAQIGILAELNLMRESDIKEILKKNGIKITRGRAKEAAAKVTNIDKSAAVEKKAAKMEPIKITVLPTMPDTVLDVLTQKMISCQNIIDRKTKELKEIHDFLGGFEHETVD